MFTLCTIHKIPLRKSDKEDKMGEARIEKRNAYKISAGNILISSCLCPFIWLHGRCPEGLQFQFWLLLNCTSEAYLSTK
jgi:hypothetical protein